MLNESAFSFTVHLVAKICLCKTPINATPKISRLPSSGAGPRASLDPASDPKTFRATIPPTAMAIPPHTLCGGGEEQAPQQKDSEQEDGTERLEEQNEHVTLERYSSLPSRRMRAGGRMAEPTALLSPWSARRQ